MSNLERVQSSFGCLRLINQYEGLKGFNKIEWRMFIRFITCRCQTSIAGRDELVFALSAHQLADSGGSIICKIHGNVSQILRCACFRLYIKKSMKILRSGKRLERSEAQLKTIGGKKMLHLCTAKYV